MSNSIKWLIVAGSICVLLLAACGAFIVAGSIHNFFRPYADYELSGPVTISSDWVEFTPKEPLRVERQIQQVVLDLDNSVKVERGGWGLVLPDGSVVTPEVQLIDQDGRAYNLDHPAVWQSSSTGATFREFSSPDLPKNKVYRAVRIRADKGVRCNRVLWRNYNQRDVS